MIAIEILEEKIKERIKELNELFDGDSSENQQCVWELKEILLGELIPESIKEAADTEMIKEKEKSK